MVARGHTLSTLMNYPISTLRGLMSASQYNRKNDIVVDVQLNAVAVLNGLDAGFNKGKQKFLKKFIDKIQATQKVRGKDSQGDGEKLLSAFGLKAP